MTEKEATLSYTVINELFVELVDAETFEKNFAASMTGTLKGVEGLLGARLLAPRSEDRGYLSVLEFADRSAYESYLSSPAFSEAHSWPDHAPFHSNRLSEFSSILDL